MKFKKHSIFSPYFYQVSLDEDCSELRKSLIDKIIQISLLEGKNDNAWNIHTSFHDDVIPELNDYKNIYNKYINAFIKKVLKSDSKYSINHLWYNIYREGDSGPTHTHSGENRCFFSCVHYLKFNPEIHNSITFLNSRRASNKSLAKQNIEFKNLDFYKDEFTPNLKEDDLIFFPANLAHKVEPSTTDEPRITIAFNIGLND